MELYTTFLTLDTKELWCGYFCSLLYVEEDILIVDLEKCWYHHQEIFSVKFFNQLKPINTFNQSNSQLYLTCLFWQNSFPLHAHDGFNFMVVDQSQTKALIKKKNSSVFQVFILYLVIWNRSILMKHRIKGLEKFSFVLLLVANANKCYITVLDSTG